MDTYTSQLVTCVALTLNEEALDTDVPAFLSGGRTMVPVRVISEALGAQVQWNQDAKEITITSQQRTIVLIIDSATAMVDGQAVDLFDGVPATLVRQAASTGPWCRYDLSPSSWGPRSAGIRPPIPPGSRLPPLQSRLRNRSLLPAK